MSDKEERLLEEITNFYQRNKLMPTIRYLKDKLNYQSNYSIQRLLKSLEKQNYLKRNEKNKLILYSDMTPKEDGLKIIEIINTKEKVAAILNKRKKYVGYIIKNNYLKKDKILKNDILIIERTSKLQNNDIGLFIIDKKYYIMKYRYKDGFYILSNKEEIILNKVQIVGKLIMIKRKI